LSALARRVVSHRATDGECFFALWDGHGWSESIPPAVPKQVVAGPRLHHPGRDYIVFAGTLSALATLGHRWIDDIDETQSPNFFWPADRSWCVATEIEFDSALVAGSSELIGSLLADPALEARPVGPDDST